jgi:hypothetical protein
MKSSLNYLLLASIIWLGSACSGSSGTDSAAVNTDTSTEVLICEGEDAYAYHDHECMGFNQCEASSSWVSLDEAQEMGRRPCGYCY